MSKLGKDIEAFGKKLEDAKKKFKEMEKDKEKVTEKDKEKETEKDKEKDTEKDKEKDKEEDKTADTIILSGDTIYENLLDVGSTFDLHDYYKYQDNTDDSWSDPGSPLHMSTPRKTC